MFRALLVAFAILVAIASNVSADGYLFGPFKRTGTTIYIDLRNLEIRSPATFRPPIGSGTTSTECDNELQRGRIFISTGATSGEQIFVCEGAGGWVLQGDGGGSGGLLASTQTWSGQNTYEADVTISSNVTITGGTLKVGSTPVPAILTIIVPISAASFTGTNTSGIPPIETGETATNAINYDYAITDEVVASSFTFSYSPPDGWDAGTMTYQVVWTSTGTSGGVAFTLQALATGNDDTLDAAYGTAITVTDTFIASLDTHITAESSALTIGGSPVAGDYVTWKGSRDVAHASDTLDKPALILELRLKYTRSSYSD